MITSASETASDDSEPTLVVPMLERAAKAAVGVAHQVGCVLSTGRLSTKGGSRPWT